MSESFHEYDFPVDGSVHWHELKVELRERATTTADRTAVTCRGCRQWLREKENFQ